MLISEWHMTYDLRLSKQCSTLVSIRSRIFILLLTEMLLTRLNFEVWVMVNIKQLSKVILCCNLAYGESRVFCWHKPGSEVDDTQGES
jgi:hypothetical protein